MGTLRNCHWLVNDSFESLIEKCHWLVNDRFHRDPAIMCTFGSCHWWFWNSSFKKCHWLVNDSFKSPIFSELMAICHWLQSTTKIYGHLSLTAVNDRNLWPNLPKSVIDCGQWQKKCHWLDVYYIWMWSITISCQVLQNQVNWSNDMVQ